MVDSKAGQGECNMTLKDFVVQERGYSMGQRCQPERVLNGQGCNNLNKINNILLEIRRRK